MADTNESDTGCVMKTWPWHNHGVVLYFIFSLNITDDVPLGDSFHTSGYVDQFWMNE